MWADLAVRGSIAAATLSWAAAEWLRWRHPARMTDARALWTAGAVLLLAHALAVFHYIHHWSQDAALEHTARQTAALTGLDWGGGLYVNYAFIGLWLWDAAAWWANPDGYARRSGRGRTLLLAIFLFMFVNAGIVFARGPARIVGLIAVAVVVWARRHSERKTRRMKDVAGRLSVVVLLSPFLAFCGGIGVRQFLAFEAPIVALTHVRVIDGTGKPGLEDQTVVIESDKIAAVGATGAVVIPPGAKVLDLPGRTVLPGLVGMHDHLFYQMGQHLAVPAQESFAMLYLASGVTTIRTAGALDFAGDLRIKRLIDAGHQPGPTIHVSSPYLYAAAATPDPERSARQVADWADQGATSFKAYQSLRGDELKAAIQAAHQRGLKLTGHLCAVGFREAVALEIDNLEHGLMVDTEFFSGKQPDQCPGQSETLGELQSIDVSGPAVRQLISLLVRRGVAITSTLAVFETFTAHAQLDPRTLDVLVPRLQDTYRTEQAKRADPNAAGMAAWSRLLRKEMEFERAFFAAGGRLLAGVDPTGWGGIVAGFGNQRQLELLVAAGLRPEEAIRVASANGAYFLEEGLIGTVTAGLQADLFVVNGNPSANISDIRNVEVVFKKGLAYDPAKLIAATQGTVGRFDITVYTRSRWMWLAGALFAIIVARRLRRRFGSTIGGA